MTTITASPLAAGIAQVGIARPINWDEMSSSGKDMWEERQVRSLVKEGKALDVWMHFEQEDDEEPDHEANVFFNADGTYRADWYHVSVGQITSRTFPTYAEATKWLEDGGYIDFSS
jgi:hypothetical protein